MQDYVQRIDCYLNWLSMLLSEPWEMQIYLAVFLASERPNHFYSVFGHD